MATAQLSKPQHHKRCDDMADAMAQQAAKMHAFHVYKGAVLINGYSAATTANNSSSIAFSS